MAGRKSKPRRTMLFLTCVLAVPTVAFILYGPPEHMTLQALSPLIATGALLGVFHLVLRPLLRFIAAPLGCITLGLAGTAVDVGLIYLAAHFVKGFPMPGFSYALITAMVINFIAACVGARK